MSTRHSKWGSVAAPEYEINHVQFYDDNSLLAEFTNIYRPIKGELIELEARGGVATFQVTNVLHVPKLNRIEVDVILRPDVVRK